MYSMVTIVINTVFYVYLKLVKRGNLKSSQHKEKHRHCVRWCVLTRLEVIILQYIHISNLHVIYLWLVSCYVSFTSWNGGEYVKTVPGTY